MTRFGAGRAMPLLAATCLLMNVACGRAQSSSSAAASPTFKTVALRGDEAGRQPLGEAIVDQHGDVYASMKFGLYRVHLNGSYEPYVTVPRCSHSSAIAVPVLSEVCVDTGSLVDHSPLGNHQIVLDQPWWAAADPRYASDSKIVTYVSRTENGDWHVVYGYARGVATIRARGAQSLHRIPGDAIVRSAAFAGEQGMLTDEKCNVIHLRRDVVVATESLHCATSPRVIAAGGAFWIMGAAPGTLERWSFDGSRRRWNFESEPWSVAVNPADGTAYVVAMPREPNTATVLITIPRDGKPASVPLGFEGGSNVTIDHACRLWITVALAHSFAVVTPPGQAAEDCRFSPGASRRA